MSSEVVTVVVVFGRLDRRALQHVDYSICTLEFETRRESYYWVRRPSRRAVPSRVARAVGRLRSRRSPQCVLVARRRPRTAVALDDGVVALTTARQTHPVAVVWFVSSCLPAAPRACSRRGGHCLRFFAVVRCVRSNDRATHNTPPPSRHSRRFSYSSLHRRQVLEAIGAFRPKVYEMSRVNVTFIVLSKRKLIKVSRDDVALKDLVP